MNALAKEILTKTHKTPLRGKNLKSIAVYGSGEALSRYATKETEEGHSRKRVFKMSSFDSFHAVRAGSLS